MIDFTNINLIRFDVSLALGASRLPGAGQHWEGAGPKIIKFWLNSARTAREYLYGVNPDPVHFTFTSELSRRGCQLSSSNEEKQQLTKIKLIDIKLNLRI